MLGRAADVWGYQSSYLISAGILSAAIPFIARSRAENTPADRIEAQQPCGPHQATSALETQTPEPATLGQ